MKALYRLIAFLVFIISARSNSQEFYVNISNPSVPKNDIQKLNIANQNQISIPFCTPTINTTEVYTDIAIDSSSNMYYITQVGELYKRDNANSTCSYLGHFSTSPSTYYLVNSLVSDSGNYLYAVVGSKDLFKYDINSGTFSSLGILPNPHISGGDLFFYENRLFLLTSTGILEINMINPSQSCYLMNINLPNLFAGFSINYGTHSKAYILSYNYTVNNSQLYEIDMVHNQTIGPLRTYNYLINGAASIYNLNSTDSSCTPNLNLQETIADTEYLNVINPAKNDIIVQTNIKRDEIISIQLFDNSGRLIKDFSIQNINKLDILGIVSGNYLLTLSTKNGKTYTKKIIIKS